MHECEAVRPLPRRVCGAPRLGHAARRLVLLRGVACRCVRAPRSACCRAASAACTSISPLLSHSFSSCRTTSPRAATVPCSWPISTFAASSAARLASRAIVAAAHSRSASSLALTSGGTLASAASDLPCISSASRAAAAARASAAAARPSAASALAAPCLVLINPEL